MVPELSDVTQELLSYILRGVRKGFKVDIVEVLDNWECTQEEKATVARELWLLSDQREEWNVLMSWGFGLKEIPPEPKTL